jgi:predicted Zn-dependent protease
MEQMEAAIDADALMARVEQLIEQGRPGAARPLLAAARGIAPPSAGMSMLAARLALSDGRLDAAQYELDRALEIAPDHAGLRRCRAEVRRQLGDLEGATRDAAEAVVFSAADPAAKALLGDLLFDLGRRDRLHARGTVRRAARRHLQGAVVAGFACHRRLTWRDAGFARRYRGAAGLGGDA